MFNIKGFLNKFTHITPPHGTVKRDIIEIIEKETGIVLDQKKISMQGKTVYIHASSAVKNEIFINKRLILEKIKHKNNTYSICDIR